MGRKRTAEGLDGGETTPEIGGVQEVSLRSPGAWEEAIQTRHQLKVQGSAQVLPLGLIATCR